MLIFRTYIFVFQTYISICKTSILRTDILKFFKQILAFTKHILILQIDINCFFKQVLIFPYKYYLRYRRYRT